MRRAELVQACATLGVPADRVLQVDDEQLQDGPENEWPAPLVALQVQRAVGRTGARAIVTFDAAGVSGHPNHGACYRGVRFAADRDALRGVSVWTLTSLPLHFKYTASVGAAHLLLSPSARPRALPGLWLGADDVVVAAQPSPARARACMLQHASQFVWFRHLFLAFSTYPLANQLVRRVRA